MRDDNLLFQAMVSALHSVWGQLGPRRAQALAREYLQLNVHYDEALAEVSSPLPLHRLARLLDDPALAGHAFLLSARVLGENESAARVYLDDLAEWLMLPPLEYRRLRQEAASLSCEAA